MKVQVINTDFLHDGTYYYQNSIIDMPPDIVKKYPRILFEYFPSEKAVPEISQEEISQEKDLNQSRQVGTKKNKRGRKC